MQTIQRITIPTPCNQSWQDMTPENNGRHCTQCSKVVSDFTKMTDSQIINYLATGSNICGRIDQKQLMAINRQLLTEGVSPSSRFKGWVLAIGLLGSMSFFKANAQTKPAVKQITETTPINYYIPITGVRPPADPVIIKGIVLDEINQPIPGALIIIVHITVAQTDVSGKFIIPKEYGMQQFYVSFIGYITQIVTIDNTMSVYQIKLKEVQQMLGEVVIIKRASFIKRTYNRYIRRPIYRLFK